MPKLHGVLVRTRAYPGSWTRIDARPEVLYEGHQGRGAHGGHPRSESHEDLLPAGSCQCCGRAQACADEALCGLPHEGQVIELRRGVSVGNPGEERLDALLEEGVARVIIIVGGGRSAHRRRPACRAADRGSMGRLGASIRTWKARSSRPERAAGRPLQITGGGTQPQRRVCGSVRSGPQSHDVRPYKASRLSSSGLTREPSARGSVDVSRGEPKDGEGVDRDVLAGRRDATGGMLSISGAEMAEERM